MGRTELHDGSWAKESYWGIAGRSLSIGNGTGCINYAGDADDDAAKPAYMSYRGIEDLYGNVWTFVDGINIKDYVPYISNNPANFDDDVFSGDYVNVGVTLPSSNGYSGRLGNTSAGFFPVDISGSSSSRLSDYWWQNSGNRILLAGGGAVDGVHAGAFYLSDSWTSSDSNAYVGARSQFKV